MIEKAGEELDHEGLAMLCHERQLHRRQNSRNDVNSKLAEIARDSRPCGIEQEEGNANEVWHHILQQTTDPFEIKKQWKVSEMFRDILREKYIETMIPEIVKLVLEKRPNYLRPNNAGENWKKSTTFYNFRAVSKQCNRSVEHICTSERCDMTCVRIDSVRTLRRILGKSYFFNAASFFPCYLLVNDNEEVSHWIRQFESSILHLLKVVGHRIRFFTFKTFMNNPKEMYDCLQWWVKYMPNLTHICLGHHHQMMEDHSTSLLEIEPFPGLPNLRFFEETEGELPTIYLQRILEASPGIMDLRLWREHSPEIQIIETLENLTSLQIQPNGLLRDYNRRVPWKLSHLRLCRKYTAPIASYRLFHFLKQFDETLEHLEVKMVDVIDSCEYLELRNLKTLKMELHPTFENLNFLLYAERLETLCLVIGWNLDWNLEPQVKLRGIVERSFLGTSLWEVFPNLKSYRVETVSCDGVKAVVEEFRLRL